MFHLSGEFIDYRLNLVGNSLSANGIKNLTMHDFLSFEPGDEFHHLTKNIYSSGYPDFISEENTNRIIIHVLSKKETPDLYSYQLKRRIAYWNHVSGKPESQGVRSDTLTLSYSKKQYDFLNHEPGEPENRPFSDFQFYYITPDGMQKKTSVITALRGAEDNDTCLNRMFDVSASQYAFIKGAGVFQKDYSYNAGSGGYSSESTELVYMKNKSATWGTPFPDNVGLNEKANFMRLSVYPNPANDKLIFEAADHHVLSVKITTIDGRLLLKCKIKNGDKIDVTPLGNGFYYYTVENGDQTLTGKLQVAR